MAAKVGQIVVNGCQFFLQHAGDLACSIGGSIGRVRFDQIDHCFCLGQRQLAVEESPLGKLTPACGTGPGDVQAFQSCCQHGGGAVAVKLHRVFAGVGMGCPGKNGAAVVNGAALLVV